MELATARSRGTPVGRVVTDRYTDRRTDRHTDLPLISVTELELCWKAMNAALKRHSC
jgi:hypothetical protein